MKWRLEQSSCYGWPLLAFCWMVICVTATLARLVPPPAATANAPATEFSSARALEHLQIIAQAPHPIGSLEQAAVREYLLRELVALGLQPEIQQGDVADSGNGALISAGAPQNIVAKLPGAEGAPAVLLMGHYDSAPGSPGASDDGYAVAALLETLRALTAGPPLKRDVIVLFTDGEEAGLLGAKLFIEQHRWSGDIGLVLNFEARGNRGPVLMFETSNANSLSLDAFAEAAPRVFASSIFDEVYTRLPNGTDFTRFKDRGIPGFNFANIDGYAAYHATLDTVANADGRTLQHHGLYALALTRHFGTQALSSQPADQRIYFDLLGMTLIHYSYPMAIALLAASLGTLGAVGLLSIKTGIASIRGILWGFAVFLLNLSMAAVAASIVLFLLDRLFPKLWLPSGDAYHGQFFLIGFVTLAAAVTASGQAFGARHARALELAFGALGWWALLTAAATIAAPGSSYLFAWPFCCALVALIAFLAAQRMLLPKPAMIIVVILASGVTLAIVAPVVVLLSIALTMHSAAIIMVVSTGIGGLLLPYLALPSQPQRWRLASGAALASLGFFAAGVIASGFDEAQPRPNSILYGLNADTGEALWASADKATDEWTEQYIPPSTSKGLLSTFFPFSANRFRIAGAPVANLAPPELTILHDVTEGGVRTLRLRVVSTRQAPLIWVYANPEAQIMGGTVNDAPLPRMENATAPGRWGLLYWGSPPEGFELTLELRTAAPVTLRVVDRVEGLPELTGTVFTDRTAAMMPTPFYGMSKFANATLVHKSFPIPAAP